MSECGKYFQFSETLRSVTFTHRQLMHWDTFKQDNYSILGGDKGMQGQRGMPDHKGFNLQ